MILLVLSHPNRKGKRQVLHCSYVYRPNDLPYLRSKGMTRYDVRRTHYCKFCHDSGSHLPMLGGEKYFHPISCIVELSL